MSYFASIYFCIFLLIACLSDDNLIYIFTICSWGRVRILSMKLEGETEVSKRELRWGSIIIYFFQFYIDYSSKISIFLYYVNRSTHVLTRKGRKIRDLFLGICGWRRGSNCSLGFILKGGAYCRRRGVFIFRNCFFRCFLALLSEFISVRERRIISYRQPRIHVFRFYFDRLFSLDRFSSHFSNFLHIFCHQPKCILRNLTFYLHSILPHTSFHLAIDKLPSRASCLLSIPLHMSYHLLAYKLLFLQSSLPTSLLRK